MRYPTPTPTPTELYCPPENVRKFVPQRVVEIKTVTLAEGPRQRGGSRLWIIHPGTLGIVLADADPADGKEVHLLVEFPFPGPRFYEGVPHTNSFLAWLPLEALEEKFQAVPTPRHTLNGACLPPASILLAERGLISDDIARAREELIQLQNLARKACEQLSLALDAVAYHAPEEFDSQEAQDSFESNQHHGWEAHTNLKIFLDQTA